MAVDLLRANILKLEKFRFSQGVQYRIESLRQTVITCIQLHLYDGAKRFYNGYGERSLSGTDWAVANRFSKSYMGLNAISIRPSFKISN